MRTHENDDHESMKKNDHDGQDHACLTFETMITEALLQLSAAERNDVVGTRRANSSSLGSKTEINKCKLYRDLSNEK